MNDEPAGRNEIGRLSRHLQQMQHSLGMTVGTVRQGAKRFIVAPAKFPGNADLSSRTEEQAAAIEQTAASMEQLTATVNRMRITRIMPVTGARGFY